MKATLSQEHGLEIVSTLNQDIAQLVVQAAEFSEPPPVPRERRSELRRPYPTVIRVTPLIDNTHEPARDTISGIGRHLSNLGLDFFHDQLIPERRAVVRLQNGGESWTHFVIELSWSRFIQSGWYVSGGRFTEVIDWDNSRASTVPS